MAEPERPDPVAPSDPDAAPPPLDVVVIIMDDLAFGDLACHGNRHVNTPNLDRLHDESVRLTRYLSGPMCTPARASLMTGRYHQRTRAYDTFCGRSMLDPSEVTLAHVFAAAGHRTGAFGKWHLGDAVPMRPSDLGFDTAVVHLAGGIGQPGDHRGNQWREGEAYFDPIVHRNGVPEQASGYCTDVFTDEAIAFVTDARTAGEPFFCYLATNTPHTPLEVPEAWIEPHRSDPDLGEVHARLYAMVDNIDWNVGRLLAAIDPERTVVVYTSDHGPCPSARDFTLPPDRQVRWNAGLRGEKGSLYQGGVKVPSFWRGPGIDGGRDLDLVTSPIDVLPTLAAALGTVGAPNVDVVIDGVDLWPVLTASDPIAVPQDRTLFLQWHRGNNQQRYRNYAVVRGATKLHRPSVDAADELYDLDADPGEQHDLAADEPATVAELRAAYDRWFDDVSTTRPDNWAPPRIHLGPAVGAAPVVLSRQDWRIDDGLAEIGEIAGWLASTAGWWEVTVPQAGTVDVEVRLDPFSWANPALAVSVDLQIGDRTWSQPWVLQCTRYTFSGIPLDRGDTTVRAHTTGGTTEQSSALYVDVTAVR